MGGGRVPNTRRLLLAASGIDDLTRIQRRYKRRGVYNRHETKIVGQKLVYRRGRWFFRFRRGVTWAVLDLVWLDSSAGGTGGVDDGGDDGDDGIDEGGSSGVFWNRTI